MARFAIKTPTQHTTWDNMLDVWTAADQHEVFESAWNFDHFYPLRGDITGPCLEAWVTLSALAQATSRIRVGSMVNGMHFRHPAVLASMASSLDIVSGGSSSWAWEPAGTRRKPRPTAWTWGPSGSE